MYAFSFSCNSSAENVELSIVAQKGRIEFSKIRLAIAILFSNKGISSYLLSLLLITTTGDFDLLNSLILLMLNLFTYN